MKKVLLSMAVVALLATSCKKVKEAGNDLKDVTVEVTDKAEKAGNDLKDAAVKATDKATEVTEDAVDAVKEGTENVVAEVKEAVQSVVDGISIPEFENPEVTKHLESYATYAKEYIAGKGDALKNAKLAKQGVALAAKGKELLGSLDEESAKKFKSVMSAIQSKLASAK